MASSPPDPNMTYASGPIFLPIGCGMTDDKSPKGKDQEKGDEVLRRLLKTPPQPHDKKDSSRTAAAKEAAKQPIKHKR